MSCNLAPWFCGDLPELQNPHLDNVFLPSLDHFPQLNSSDMLTELKSPPRQAAPVGKQAGNWSLLSTYFRKGCQEWIFVSIDQKGYFGIQFFWNFFLGLFRWDPPLWMWANQGLKISPHQLNQTDIKRPSTFKNITPWINKVLCRLLHNSHVNIKFPYEFKTQKGSRKDSWVGKKSGV